MATITVNSLSDVTAADGFTTLREALDQAARGDVIEFDASLANGTIELTQGPIAVDKSLNHIVTINGNVSGTNTSAEITIDGNGGAGVFVVENSNTLNLDSLNITGAVGGAGIHVEGGGTLTMDYSTVSDNANAAGNGGGLLVDLGGTATVTDSTFTGNSANFGGAVSNSGTVALSNVTITGNTASLFGGGLVNSNTATIEHSTITGNTASMVGGGVFGSNPATLTNTIVLGNTAPATPDIGAFNDNGGNVTTGNAADVFDGGVGTLADNGGPVQTVALKNDPLNPALDVGASTAATDARGEGRYDFPGVGNDTSNFTDAGAYELQCFAAGTGIAAPAGEIPVEALRTGDTVLTSEGRTVEIRWIGRQTVVTRLASARQEPVRIRAGALGGGLPHSDLTITADHGMIVDGLVINASALVNGTTIDWVPLAELPELVTYYHVETEAHDLILANGAPAETFIDYAGRQAFDNYDAYIELYGAERIIPEMDRPRISAQRLVPDAIKARLGLVDEVIDWDAALSA